MSRQRVTTKGHELRERHLLFAAGMRYRKHYPVLGYPRRSINTAYSLRRSTMFLDSCFWHGCAQHKSVLKANDGWSVNKIEANKRRDSKTTVELEGRGWRDMRLREHEEPDTVMIAITRELTRTNGERVDGQD